MGALQQYTLALWAARNDILYDGTTETDAIINARLNEEILQIYMDKETYQPSDRSYFYIPVERILQRMARGRQ